jgi:hypothetical protein
VFEFDAWERLGHFRQALYVDLGLQPGIWEIGAMGQRRAVRRSFRMPYLNALDQDVEQELLPVYNRGTRRHEHPRYTVLLQRAQRVRRRGRGEEAQAI